MNNSQMNGEDRSVRTINLPVGRAVVRRGALVLTLGAFGGALLLPPMAAFASGGGDDHMVTYCHRRNAETNPYGPKAITTDKSAVFKKGHDGHTGPVFEPGMKADKDKWGDIIPPFDYVDNKGVTQHYAGMNWPEGKDILANNCQLPGEPSTTTTTTGHTSSSTSSTSSSSSTSSTSSSSSTTTTPTDNHGDGNAESYCVGTKPTVSGRAFNESDLGASVKVTSDIGSTTLEVPAQSFKGYEFTASESSIEDGTVTFDFTWSDGSMKSYDSDYSAVSCTSSSSSTTSSSPTTSHPSPTTKKPKPTKSTSTPSKSTPVTPVTTPNTNAPTPGIVDTDGGQVNFLSPSDGGPLNPAGGALIGMALGAMGFALKERKHNNRVPARAPKHN